MSEPNNVASNAGANGHGSATDEPYSASSQYHSQPSHLRVICAGAGAAGILVAYRMQKSFENYDLVCYDKNPHIGGTWYENRYPGCACDLPAHGYVYPFEQNPNWSEFYASAPEILKYFEDFVDKYGLHRFIKLNSRVRSAVWSEDEGVYHVEIETPNGVVHDWGHVFINGCGFLNNWKWPEIPGLHDFKGTLLHSANWDPSTDYEGKTVAVIGNGSSGIQIIPSVQKTAKKITCFMRSPTWILPSVASDMLPNQSTRSDEQYAYSEDEKKTFREDPTSLVEYRKGIESRMNDNYGLFIKGSETVQQVRQFLLEEMDRRIGTGHEDLKKLLTPNWSPGCNWAVGSVLASHDAQVEYITWCIMRMQTEGIKAFEVKPDPIDDLYEHIDEFHSRSIWSDNCSSWYKNGIKDGKVWIWGGSGLHYIRTIRMVRWEDYLYRYHRRNVWSFLGNGWTKAQVQKDRSRLAPYVRGEDSHWEFDE
ncbi:hypothetical protein FDECE_3455 [Fusarium decemcellulare]|nr:hypothetical protein FDECE_3455 [Fusarium decemcellulare]